MRAFLAASAGALAEEFTEVETGKNDDRPQLSRALDACRLTGAVLVIAKLDRLSRDAHFLLGLEKAGVDFVAADMPNANRITVHIMAIIAEEEREMISRRTKDALAAAKRRGQKLGGVRRRVIRVEDSGKKVYGEQVLNVSPKTRAMAIRAVQTRADSRAQDIAPIIKELQAAGKTSLRAIAEGLNAAGVPTPRGGEWSAVQVQRVLERLDLPLRAEETAAA